jgi:hypothetical protein
MRMTASWFRSLDPWTYPHTRLWRDSTAPESGLPSDCHPDCIIVLEAVRTSSGEIEPRTRRWKNASPCLTQKAPYKGPGADSEEKHEPVSDIDTVVVDSLKALDPEWPIREADIGRIEILQCGGLLPHGVPTRAGSAVPRLDSEQFRSVPMTCRPLCCSLNIAVD